MAIGEGALELLIKLRTAGYLTPGGAVVEIGAQQLGNSFLTLPERIAHLGHLFGRDQKLPIAEPQQLPNEEIDFNLTAPFARDFWRWLGFDYAAVDIDGSPGSIPLDLNYDNVPSDAKGKYKLVTNFGTTEHIANQLNAFKIIHDLAAPDAIIIHEVPVQGMLNHGLINYNFKFFWMLARSNGYKFLHADFLAADDFSDFPGNIDEFLSANGSANQRKLDYKVRDAGTLLALQKTVDMEFVAPLDMNSGMPAENAALKERYWSIFDPEALERSQLDHARSHAAKIVDGESSSLASSQLEPDKQALANVEHVSKTQSTTANPAQSSATADQSKAIPPISAWKLTDMIKPIRTLKQLLINWEHNSTSTVAGISNLTEVLGEKTDIIAEGIANQTVLLGKTGAIADGIANQTDLMRQKLDALIRVVSELRQIQKAQLMMQRDAAEVIRQFGSADSNMEQPDRPLGGPDSTAEPAKTALKS